MKDLIIERAMYERYDGSRECAYKIFRDKEQILLPRESDQSDVHSRIWSGLRGEFRTCERTDGNACGILGIL